MSYLAACEHSIQRLEFLLAAARRREGRRAMAAAAGVRAAIVSVFDASGGASAWEEFCAVVLPAPNEWEEGRD